jgi:hypothetical protein
VVGLSQFTSSFPHDYSARFLRRTQSSRAAGDATWWLHRLKQLICSLTLAMPPPLSPIPIYMDASTSFGIGVTYAQKFAMWRFIGLWQLNGRDIGWAEMVTIELVLSLLISLDIHTASVNFFSDNQGVIGALKVGRSHNDQQNLVLQRIFSLSEASGIHICIDYISTNDNPADAPSRGHPPKGFDLITSFPHLNSALEQFLSPCR